MVQPCVHMLLGFLNIWGKNFKTCVSAINCENNLILKSHGVGELKYEKVKVQEESYYWSFCKIEREEKPHQFPLGEVAGLQQSHFECGKKKCCKSVSILCPTQIGFLLWHSIIILRICKGLVLSRVFEVRDVLTL